MRTTASRLNALLLGIALLTAGCPQGEGNGADTSDPAEGDGRAQILGAFPDPEAGFFEDSLADFEEGPAST